MATKLISGLRLPKTLINLPYIVYPKNKISSFFILVAISTIAYLYTNHFQRVTPQLLPMVFVDRWIPFIPETIFIYCSDYFLFLTAYLLCRDIRETNKFVYSFMSLQFVSFFIFWCWPTTFPRELFPLPLDMNPVAYHLFSNFRSIESPASCLPSLHVSCCYLSALQFFHQDPKKFRIFMAWATLVAFSTITTKQHYFVDVLGGMGMAVLFYWFFHSRVTYTDKPVQPKR